MGVNLRKMTVLVTGATAGFGLATVRKFAKDGAKVIGTGRRAERLADLAKQMSSQVWLLSDWLAAKAPDWVTGRLQGSQVLLHGHCHHKAVFGGPTSEIALLRQAGAAVELINSTCCGMAGPFGFEADKIEVSKAIANLGLLPAVNAAGSRR